MRRLTGKFAGEHAELTVSEDGTSRIVISLDAGDARRMAIAAVSAGGELDVELAFSGSKAKAKVIEARVDTLDSGSRKLSGPNVVSFKALKL